VTSRELIAARVQEWQSRLRWSLGEWLVRDISYEEYKLRQAIEKDQIAAAREAAKDAGV